MIGKAIFLDRDGVLTDNSSHYYIWKQEQVRLVDSVFDNLKFLIQKGFKLFIVSNQGGISRGVYSKADSIQLHAQLIQTFRNQQIEITDIAFCPHHPEKENCFCRKPASLMIDKLIAKYGVNKTDSYFIGDSQSDMDAAKEAGISGIKIIPNQNMYPFISFLNQ